MRIALLVVVGVVLGCGSTKPRPHMTSEQRAEHDRVTAERRRDEEQRRADQQRREQKLRDQEERRRIQREQRRVIKY